MTVRKSSESVVEAQDGWHLKQLQQLIGSTECERELYWFRCGGVVLGQRFKDVFHVSVAF